MGLTITSNGTTTLQLTNPSYNPVTIAAGASIVTPYGNDIYAIIGSSAVSWSIMNQGAVVGAVGIALAGDGFVTNDTGAIIHGAYYGLEMGGRGTVTNNGSISGGYGGVRLEGGGSVTNGSSSNHAAYIGGLTGVSVDEPGTVTNYGSIVGYNNSYPGLSGVAIVSGLVTNGSLADTIASISGYYAIFMGEPGTVVNHGIINGVEDGVHFFSTAGTTVSGLHATITNGAINQSGAIIEGNRYGIDLSGQAGVITNFGTILGADSQSASLVLATGTVTNGSSVLASTGARIAGGLDGIVVTGKAGLVENYGVVSGGNQASGVGVLLQGAGHVINGSIAVKNASIVANGVGVQVSGGFSTVGNDGTILASGSAAIGVLATAGGKVNNGFYGVTSALISGTGLGVYVSNGLATVINSGTITGAVGVAFGPSVPTATLTNTGTIAGASGIAATFASGNDVVAIGAGAVLHGAVVASATGANTLQLMSGPAAGTVSGIGSQFQRFHNLSVLGGAQWSLAGTNNGGPDLGIQLGAGSKLTDKGTLAVGSTLALTGPGSLSIASTGKIVVGQAGTGALGALTVDAAHGAGAAGTLTGNGVVVGNVSDGGTVVASGGTLALDGNVSGTGTVAITAHAVLDAGQSLSAARLVFMAGAGEALELGKPASVSSLISGFVAGDRIDLLGEVARGLSYAGSTHILTVSGASGSLAHLHFAGAYTTASFHLASDGHGGTNITVR